MSKTSFFYRVLGSAYGAAIPLPITDTAILPPSTAPVDEKREANRKTDNEGDSRPAKKRKGPDMPLDSVFDADPWTVPIHLRSRFAAPPQIQDPVEQAAYWRDCFCAERAAHSAVAARFRQEAAEVVALRRKLDEATDGLTGLLGRLKKRN